MQILITEPNMHLEHQDMVAKWNHLQLSHYVVDFSILFLHDHRTTELHEYQDH
jgi:hypothetical protein